jgi:hypothetical protein
MKAFVLILGLVWVLCSCTGETEPLPAESWSEGCVELSPHNNDYRLAGMCCAFMILPILRLDKNQSFSVSGRYNTFTGAGYAETVVTVTGRFSTPDNILLIEYPLNGQTITHRLQAGRATVACLCGCD